MATSRAMNWKTRNSVHPTELGPLESIRTLVCVMHPTHTKQKTTIHMQNPLKYTTTIEGITLSWNDTEQSWVIPGRSFRHSAIALLRH